MPKTPSVMACAPAFGAPLDLRENTRAILHRMDQAREKGAHILLLPELCLSGGSCGAAFRQQIFLDTCVEAAGEIAEKTDGLLVAFGLPLLQTRETRKVYNALAVACDGKMLGFVIKARLKPHQKIYFDSQPPEEARWLGQALPNFRDGVISLKALGFPGTALIGFGDERWPLLPADGLSKHQAVLLAFLRPAAAGQLRPAFPLGTDWFKEIPCLAIANAGGNESTTDLAYPGGAAIFRYGRLVSEAAPFTQESACSLPLENGEEHPAWAGYAAFHEPDPRMPYAPKDPVARALWCRDCLEIAAQGLAIRMQRIGSRAATLGVSGGLDSAMALLITKRAFELLGLPLERIYGYSLPGLGSSGRTRDNALRLLGALGLTPREIDLKASILRHFEDIHQDRDTHDAAFENAQARERTQVLMDLANQVGGLMVGSGDLSELALGFTTFGGDHLSMYGVNGGLYKTAIRLILHQCALDAGEGMLKDTLMDILDTPISPELLPGKDGGISQKTEDILGPYVLNDYFLYYFLMGHLTPAQLAQNALEDFMGQFTKEELVARLRAFIQRFFRNQFKRNCLPDGPSILGHSLSPREGFALPSDASARVWLDAIDEMMKG